ncbi:hypothetical protein GNI_097230 [Gregarina niphandrodes]|uniref:Uncharacterized protein n=1 Tax=Gregarina niphandrodes TaxID=110365 RepID=A0A023B4U7_GRENI|nr:hypothetical protein GNI_097230 [Gregarina niphandrodes]EZG57647.1 hypothetical protein GNI_097230 [Gregarina niphandrodes]|eukprot:XP_011131039.1 hypothetical protein GNI_097230 [Gregarina niphandrodes]
MKFSACVFGVLGAGAYVPAVDRFYPESACVPPEGGVVGDIAVSCIEKENNAANAFTLLHTNVTDAAANAKPGCADDEKRVFAYGPYANYMLTGEGVNATTYPLGPYSVLVANVDVNNLENNSAEDEETAPCDITLWVIAKGTACPDAKDTANQYKYSTLKDVDDGEKDTETWQYSIMDGPLVAANGDAWFWYADITKCVSSASVRPNVYFRQAIVGTAGAGNQSGATAAFVTAPLLATAALAALYL